MIDANRLEELRAEAKHHRARYELYRARLYAGRVDSLPRLRELEQASDAALERLRHAERQARSSTL